MLARSSPDLAPQTPPLAGTGADGGASWHLRAFEALPAGVVVLNGRGVVEACNPAARKLLGEDPRGAPWRRLAEHAFRPRPDDGPDVSLADGRRVSIATCSLGPGPGQVLLLQDVSEVRALQSRLSQLERLSAVGEMVAALAHQVRTPLAAALLYAGTLGRAAQGTPARQSAERLLAVLRHLEGLVRDLLLFARRGSFEVEDVEVDGLLASLAGQPAAGAPLRLVVTTGSGRARVRGSRQALASALANLVENARDAGATEVRVSSRRDGEGRVCLEVADDGPGVPPEVRERVFEPFFTTRPGGNGLGLAVVRSVARAHGGEALLVEGPGGCFRMVLPVWSDPQEDDGPRRGRGGGEE